MNRTINILSVMLVAMLATACGMVDQAEHCVGTRGGKVTVQKETPGWTAMMLTDYECFPLTDVQFPEGDEAESMDVQTSDPVTLGLEVSMIYAYDPATVYTQFLEKRSQYKVEQEIVNSLRSGTRDAVAGWSVAEVFSPQRAALADSIRASVARKLGKRAVLKQVYVRKIQAPEAIEKARIIAAQQDQVLDQARKKAVIDSVQAAAALFEKRATAEATVFTAKANAEASVMKAKADNEARKLTAQVYEQNPELLRLEIEKARASICSGAQQCILGTQMPFNWSK